MISNNHDKSVKHVFSVFPYSFFSVFNHIPFIPGSVFLYSWPLSPPPGLVSLHSWLSILSVFLAFVSSSWPCVPSFLAQYSFRIPGLRLLLLALCPFIPGSVFFPYSWPSSPPPGLVSLHSWLSILSLFLALCPFIPGSVFFPYSWPSSPPPGLVSLHSWLSILSVFLAFVSSSWPCVPSFLAQYSFRIPGPCLLLLALCPFIPGSVFFPYSWPLSPPPGLVSLHSWLSILSVFLAFVPSLLAAETFVNVELQRHPTE